MNKAIVIIVGIIILLGGYFVLKGKNAIPNSANKLQISASFYPLYFFASQIAGDKADVKNITPAGSEPHDYDPPTQDIARIENGNMLVLNGAVEGWGSKIKENLKSKNVEIVVAGEKLLSKQIEENGEIVKDPHVWLNPLLAKKEIAKITEGFIKIDPTNKQYYEENEKKLDSKLDQLDSSFKEGLKSCQQKDIITSHAAFAYLAEQYGLNQVSVSGISPDEEPSGKQLAQVADFARKNSVKYIFFESLVSPKLSETIAHEIGAKTLVLDPIEGLSDDDIKAGKDYFSVMENNLKNLQIALECKH